MQTKRPDDATGDSVLLARVHTFLAALLSFLGFGVLPMATIADMLDELTGWLEMAKAIRRDPQGATARIWWDAFKASWGECSTVDAAKAADVAVAAFGQRFLPVNAEDDRDTLNTADFDALREELDKQTQIAAELRSERDALLAANALHARELQISRDGNDVFRAALYGAMGWREDPGFDSIAEVLSIRAERDELRAKLGTAIIPLPKPERVEPGQRWALVRTVIDRAEQDGVVSGLHNSRQGAASEDNMLANENRYWFYLGMETK